MQMKDNSWRCQDHGLSASELARNLGRKLRYLRAQKGYTQAELSKRLFMGRAHLSRLERGKTLPQFLTVVRLAACLGVSPADLMGTEVSSDCNCSNEPQ
jgi:transcriptional regulator with XRE-family HTH domain